MAPSLLSLLNWFSPPRRLQARPLSSFPCDSPPLCFSYSLWFSCLPLQRWDAKLDQGLPGRALPSENTAQGQAQPMDPSLGNRTAPAGLLS